MEDVVDALVFPGLFIRRHIPAVLHDHDLPVIPLGVRADGAGLRVRQGTADLAVVDVRAC